MDEEKHGEGAVRHSDGSLTDIDFWSFTDEDEALLDKAWGIEPDGIDIPDEETPKEGEK